MATGAAVWFGKVNEDGSFSVLARVTALEGTGTEVQAEEGPSLKQVDVSAITCKVYDLGTNRDAQTGTPVAPDPVLTPAANLFDTLRTSGWPTKRDKAGYNFRHDVAATYCTSPENWYLLEYKFTVTGGGVIWLEVRVETRSKVQS